MAAAPQACAPEGSTLNDAAAPPLDAVHGDLALHALAQEILSLKARLEALTDSA